MGNEGLWLQWNAKLLALFARLVTAADHAGALLNIPGAHFDPHGNPLSQEQNVFVTWSNIKMMPLLRGQLCPVQQEHRVLCLM